MASWALQTLERIAQPARPARALLAVERWLEAERDNLPLWIPVALGAGIGAYFALPSQDEWLAILALFAGCALAGVAIGPGRRSGRALTWFGSVAALGLLLTMLRVWAVAAPVLDRPGLHRFEAVVERVQPLPARGDVRVLVAPDPAAGLPPQIRLTMGEAAAPERLARGDRLRVRVWLMPPAPAAVPGSYDFARAAWFAGIGATGRVMGQVERVEGDGGGGAGVRQRLNAHIRNQLDGVRGGVAAALATGDQGAIPETDAEAMRRSGLAHLLSISGLHVTAVVGAAMLLTLRLLDLSPALALRWPLLLVAAAAGALAGIGYTLLAGAEVPTVRSCVAALLVLGGIALGRDAITLRLVAAGALFVLLLWPESLVGASFQMSFAAVTAIVALHGHPRIRALIARRDEAWERRLARTGLSLLLTGLAVELVLSPIAIYHFHKAGLYGALANIVAIPLTTFVTMPLEAAALLLDLVGLGRPFWWLTGLSIDLILCIAHTVAAVPGSVAAVPTMATGAFALAIVGALWMLLWQRRVRWLGALPFAAGMIAGLASPMPDLLVTGDGRHLLLVDDDGRPVLLRKRSGDYVRDMLMSAAGHGGTPASIESATGARCGDDACLITLQRGNRNWQLLAIRSRAMLPWRELVAACAASDIVVADRRLPPACAPRWLKLDRPALAARGGAAIHLDPPDVHHVRDVGTDHPWARRPTMNQRQHSASR